MRILIADDELARSKTLRSLFGAGTQSALDIGRLVVARASQQHGGKKGARGRAGAAAGGSTSIDLGDQPEHVAAILDALGISLLNRGLFDEGSQLIELALKIRRNFFGNDHPATASSLNSFSRVQRERGDYEGATASVQDALRINRKAFGDKGWPVSASLKELGLVQLLQGLFREAEQSAGEGLDILRSLCLADVDPNTTRLMDVIGRAQTALGRLDEAEETHETLLQLDRKQLGTRNHPKYATHLANFGLVKEAQKKRKQAAAVYRNAIELYSNTLNRQQHPNLIDAHANLGSLLRTPPADLKAAGKHLRKALELDLRVRGESHPLVGNDYANLGRWLYDTGAVAEAVKSFARALDIYARNVRARSLPPDHFFIAEALTWQGRIAVEKGTAAGGKQAEPLLRRAVEIWPAQLGPGSVGEAMATGYLGRALALQGLDPTEACRLLCLGYQSLKSNPQASPAVIKQFLIWLKQQGCRCDGPATAA
jgi:tetratricopeptide (TPR) repeat protein